jgi:hypothetical protein
MNPNSPIVQAVLAFKKKGEEQLTAAQIQKALIHYVGNPMKTVMTTAAAQLDPANQQTPILGNIRYLNKQVATAMGDELTYADPNAKPEERIADAMNRYGETFMGGHGDIPGASKIVQAYPDVHPALHPFIAEGKKYKTAQEFIDAIDPQDNKSRLFQDLQAKQKELVKVPTTKDFEEFIQKGDPKRYAKIVAAEKEADRLVDVLDQGIRKGRGIDIKQVYRGDSTLRNYAAQAFEKAHTQPQITDDAQAGLSDAKDPFQFIQAKVPGVKNVDPKSGIIKMADGTEVELGFDGRQIHSIRANKSGTGAGTKVIDALKEWAFENKTHLTIDRAANEGYWAKQGFKSSQGGGEFGWSYDPMENLTDIKRIRSSRVPQQAGLSDTRNMQGVKDANKGYRQGGKLTQWTDDTGKTAEDAQKALQREQVANPTEKFVLKKQGDYYRIYKEERVAQPSLSDSPIAQATATLVKQKKR